MSIRPLLKTPFFIGGAILTGAGGVGAGGWQIYEESNPTVDRQLRKQRFSYKLFTAPNEQKTGNEAFGWKSWDCVKRLFPEIDVQHMAATNDSVGSISASTPSAINDVGNFLACAMMEMQPIPQSGNGNYIYLRSEVVIKSKNYGLIILTGLSTIKEGTSHREFQHRMLRLKKEGGNSWQVMSGYGWEDTLLNSATSEEIEFVIAPPMNEDQWFHENNVRKSSDTTSFDKKLWAGIGEMDGNNQKSKDLLHSISIYVKGKEGSVELWGSDGEFNKSGAGYTLANYFYNLSGGGGWLKVQATQGATTSNIAGTLKAWYKPFKDKKIKWTDWKARCEAFSRGRKQPTTDTEKDLQSLCYQKIEE